MTTILTYSQLPIPVTENIGDPVIWTAAVYMLCFLALSAWSDKHGAQVADYLTVPYALLGLLVGIVEGRIVSTVLAACMLLMTLSSWRPKWLKRINAAIVERAYRSREAMDEQSQELEEEANAFEKEHGLWLYQTSYRLGAVSSAGITLSAMFMLGGMKGNEVERALRITCAVILFLAAMISYYRFGWSTGDVEQGGDDTFSAIGGADVILFIGMWGFYGTIPMMFMLVATCGVYLLQIGIKCLREKKRIDASPMVPAMLYAAPIRVILAIWVCPAITRDVIWILQYFMST